MRTRLIRGIHKFSKRTVKIMNAISPTRNLGSSTPTKTIALHAKQTQAVLTFIKDVISHSANLASLHKARSHQPSTRTNPQTYYRRSGSKIIKILQIVTSTLRNDASISHALIDDSSAHCVGTTFKENVSYLTLLRSVAHKCTSTASPQYSVDTPRQRARQNFTSLHKYRQE